MPNFYFLIRFLAHSDNIVRSRIAYLFLEHKINDDAISTMVIHAVRSFGISENLPSLRLLPYQDITSEQLGFFLAQRENLGESIASGGSSPSKVLVAVLEQYDTILKKLIVSCNYHVVKPFIDDLSPEFLKAICMKKWRQTIYRDLFKVYSTYPPQQILPRIHEFISKHKRKTIKRSHLAELRIWSEVFYVNFTKVKNRNHKKAFFEDIENYFKNLTKVPMVDVVKKVYPKKLSPKIFSLEACYYLLCAGWWSMDHLLRGIMNLFTLNCDVIVYEEAISCLLEFDESELLTVGYEFLVSHKVTDKALPYLLKLFFLPGELEESSFYARSEELLLKALDHEKHYNRRVQICLAISDLFSLEFLVQGSALLKKSHFNFPTYGKARALLQERLLVHSLITGKKVEGLDNFTNSYIEKKSGLSRLNRLNTSIFFKKQDRDNR